MRKINKLIRERAERIRQEQPGLSVTASVVNAGFYANLDSWAAPVALEMLREAEFWGAA